MLDGPGLLFWFMDISFKMKILQGMSLETWGVRGTFFQAWKMGFESQQDTQVREGWSQAVPEVGSGEGPQLLAEDMGTWQ